MTTTTEYSERVKSVARSTQNDLNTFPISMLKVGDTETRKVFEPLIADLEAVRDKLRKIAGIQEDPE